jgi:outer membrane lipoprotein carrier protein
MSANKNSTSQSQGPCLGLIASIMAILIFAFVSMPSFAKEQQDATKELKTLLSSLHNYQADFVQTIEDWSGEILQQSEGKLILQKPNQLRWQVMLPDESLFIADGRVVYNIDPFVEQVTLLDQAQIIDNNPLMLLISDDPAAWDEVSIRLSEGTYVVSSLDAEANITELALTFNDGQLSALVSKDKQRQVNRIVFENVEQNGAVPVGSFVPTYPEGYVIDDQRSAEAL